MTDVRTCAVDDLTMGGMLRWHARHCPERDAVVCGEQRVSFAELNGRANRLANALANLGLAPGDAVAVVLTNCPEYVEIYQAVPRAGMAAVPVNYRLTGPEIAYILNDSGAAAVICDAAKAEIVESLASDGEIGIPHERIIVTGAGYESLLDGAADAEPHAAVDGSEWFYLGYTSGTTGFPKGCIQRHRAFVDHYKRSFRIYGHGAPEIMLIPGPLFHEAPTLFTLGHLFHGGTVVLLPAFDPAETLAAIERERCTMLGFAVPPMLDALAATSSDRDISSLASIITAGAPLHEDTMDAVMACFPHARLREFYGATEVGLVTDVVHNDHRDKGRTTGTAVPGVNVAVLDDDDNALPPGETGQVFITPVMMDGYHNRPDATAEDTREFDGVRWFTLGDMGYLDREGFLYLVDRKKDMIISGGENVYPVEVENVLLRHPRIRDAAVLGMPDERWGEAVTAVVVASGETPQPDELKDFCRERLAGYKIPKRVVAADEIPRNPSGKILKHVLRDRLGSA